jgi:hypothetical protein
VGTPIVLLLLLPLISGGLPLVVEMLLVLVGGIICIYFIFRWRPICPACKTARAEWEMEGDDEYLTCASCGYREKSGWRRGGYI